MGRKRWWRGGLELLVLLVLHRVVHGDREVGCLFSKNLCNPREETCYDDLAFGKCVPLYADLEDEDLYQYNFNGEELELLRLQLERLEAEGYKWIHPYTQCIMQTSLYNLRHGETNDLRLCHQFREYDRYRSQRKFDDGDKVLNLAIVKFTPNSGNKVTDFANEVFYPPGTQNRYVRPVFQDEGVLRPDGQDLEVPRRFQGPGYGAYDYDSLYGGTERFDEQERSKKSLVLDDAEDRAFSPRRQTFVGQDYEDGDTDYSERPVEQENLSAALVEDGNAYGDKPLTEEELEFLGNLPEQFPLAKQEDEEANEYEKTFSRKYKHPRKLEEEEEAQRKEESWSDEKRNKEDEEKSVDYGGEDYEGGNGEVEAARSQNSKENVMYTEGGLVQAAKEKSDEDGNGYENSFDDDLDALMWRRELTGFKRPERLDVKKPGPPFSTNNYAFKTQSPSASEVEGRIQEEHGNNVLHNTLVKKLMMKHEYPTDDSSKSYNNVDTDHVYIEFRQPFRTWSEGEHVVEKIAKLLDLKPGTLRDTRVGLAEVTFKVVQNNKNYSAPDVVHGINGIYKELKESLGVEVYRAGIGDKVKLPPMLEAKEEHEMSSSLFGAVVAAGVAAAGAAAAVTLIIARRHAKSRAKLAGLATPDPEASKDYQDLCRARMQAKQPTDKPESPRITSLSRESESNNLPSNRSSTSSWGDEPSLSNMDISTGHMVLSYMEDHLKNKDRLDQEWAALCAYEADPSSTEIAESKENSVHNRPCAAVPYDHCRVVLNDLANAHNSDYINASTITDHDPRNPAYIATQGPLPQTTADFWQLVWEQGSVVIIMLTRLTEEGVGMCHRYWPEEGAELYHIYEVHLVSEHLWCDDYLVRSFYLKNLRTSETRTVTQFHFLSWPQNDVPHSTKALLEFRRKVNKSYRGRSCPIVVHCSDGAGRTGTYCLIDMVLNRMTKGAKEIDIAATLEHIRDQRPNMVATKQQFEFVLMAVAEEVHAILKALPVPPAEKSPAPATTGSPPKTEQ